MVFGRDELPCVSSVERDPKEILDLYERILNMETMVDGAGGKSQPLPPSLYSFLSHVYGELKAGRPVSLLKDEVALTTVEAARALGVSRQFLVQMLENHEMPFHMVGTHRRVYARDVLGFKGKRDSGRRQPQAGYLWVEEDSGNSEHGSKGAVPHMHAAAWSEIKAEVRDDLLDGDVKEPRIRLNALDRLEKDLAELYPEFQADPAVLIEAGKSTVARKIAQLRVNGMMHAAESDVLGVIFRRLEMAMAVVG
jgi:excisionase family DNA binding protein